jgi:hypothetical protein
MVKAGGPQPASGGQVLPFDVLAQDLGRALPADPAK